MNGMGVAVVLIGAETTDVWLGDTPFDATLLK
jgi:hypothetical protein